jgi:hypothetical protein
MAFPLRARSKLSCLNLMLQLDPHGGIFLTVDGQPKKGHLVSPGFTIPLGNGVNTGNAMRSKFVMAAVAAVAVSMSASMIPTSAAANIIIGNPDLGSGNSNPFGNPGTLWGPEYQQVYASSDFSGPITIRDLEFFNTQLLGGSPDSGSYTISLSTTSAQVDNLDFTTLSNNIGANNTVVFTGSLPSLVGGELHLVLSNPFTYNPVSGNLLIDVVSSDAGNTDTKLFLDAMNGDANGIFGRTYSTSGGSFNSGWGWSPASRLGGGPRALDLGDDSLRLRQPRLMRAFGRRAKVHVSSRPRKKVWSSRNMGSPRGGPFICASIVSISLSTGRSIRA